LTLSSSTGAASGSLDLNGGAGTLTFSITLPSSIFVPISPPSDNGVTQLAFTNVTYSGSATVSASGAMYGITSGTASIDGTQTPTGAGSAGLFSASDLAITGTCTDLGSLGIACGIIFNGSDFDLLVNGQTRYFTNTLNVSTVPEPSTLLLLGGGLAGLGFAGTARRSRRS
jgi:hypothetical protein